MSSHRIVHRALLAAAVSIGGYAGSEALSPITGVSLMGQAQAQFTGRIKRVKIKRRRVGSGFKIVARSEGADAGAVASAEVTISAAGDVLDALELGAAQRAATMGIIDIDGPIVDATLQVTAPIVYADGSVGEEPAESLIPLELAVGENGRVQGDGAGENGFKARARENRDGQLIVVVRHENKGWDGALTGLELLIDGEPRPMVVQGVRQRRVATTDIDLEAAGPLQVETTLFDAEGEVVDRRAEIVTVSEDVVPQVSKVTARETRGGEAKLVTITRSDGQNAQLTVDITDAETGDVVLGTVDDNPVSSVRTFFTSGVEFDGGESPGGYVYLCLVDLIDANGDPTGQQTEVELQVPEYVEGEVVMTTATFSDGLGQVVMAVDDEGYHLGVGVRGDGPIMAANVIFEEPFEGPAPLELEYRAAFDGQLDKWIQKGDGALPERYTVSTTLSDAGVVVGAVEGASGSGVGTVHKNGSGTRKAANQVKQNQQVKLL